ncbi:hypothetical protein ABZ897_42270 [Nonomuraea sp. NPDC046802]|uniref:hypothetical protein n=1 Tax=Nonomuraea sp. NPDC046802 TaxID=3154919 RepID=UPI0033F88754
MEDDHRVWPPQPAPRHRRTPPRYTWGADGLAGPARPLEPVREQDPARPSEPAHPSDRVRPYESARPRERERPQESTRPSERERPQESTRPSERERPQEHTRPSEAGRPRERLRPYESARPSESVRPPEPDWGRSGEPEPLDLSPEEPPWSPRMRSTEAWDALPPSARLHVSPADPGARGRVVASRAWGRWAGVLVAALAAVGLVATATVLVLRLTAPQEETGRLNDSLAGVTATLPQGWSEDAVTPVTGFTSVIRNEDGAVVMARSVPGPVRDVKKATAEAAELYSRLLLQGDRVSVVEDRPMPQGHTRALRAEYRDVVNRPAFLRVILLTRDEDAVMLVGLLQPEEAGRRQALDAVMTSIRRR